MAQPRLITGYLSALSAQLPAPVVAELADGLGETHLHYLRQGLDPDAAARAAVAEFGEPSLVIAGFAAVSPARRVARRLMATGPLVGACWAAALITGRAWAWPVQPAVVLLAGLVLLASIGLIVSAVTGPGYRSVVRAGLAGLRRRHRAGRVPGQRRAPRRSRDRLAHQPGPGRQPDPAHVQRPQPPLVPGGRRLQPPLTRPDLRRPAPASPAGAWSPWRRPGLPGWAAGGRAASGRCGGLPRRPPG